MFGRDRNERLSDSYPGLFRNLLLLDPEIDSDKALALVDDRIPPVLATGGGRLHLSS